MHDCLTSLLKHLHGNAAVQKHQKFVVYDVVIPMKYIQAGIFMFLCDKRHNNY